MYIFVFVSLFHFPCPLCKAGENSHKCKYFYTSMGRKYDRAPNLERLSSDSTKSSRISPWKIHACFWTWRSPEGTWGQFLGVTQGTNREMGQTSSSMVLYLILRCIHEEQRYSIQKQKTLSTNVHWPLIGYYFFIEPHRYGAHVNLDKTKIISLILVRAPFFSLSLPIIDGLDSGTH